MLSSSQPQQYLSEAPGVHIRQVVLRLIQAEGTRCSRAAIYHWSSLSFPTTGWAVSCPRAISRSLLFQSGPVLDGVQVLLVLQCEGVGHVSLLQTLQAKTLSLALREEVAIVPTPLDFLVEVLPGCLHPRLAQLLLGGEQPLQGRLLAHCHPGQQVCIIQQLDVVTPLLFPGSLLESH